MKKFLPILLLCFSTTILFTGCSSNEIKVKTTNFAAGEIQQGQMLVFTFNKDLAPDSLVNSMDTLDYLKFEPAVRGNYRWLSTNQLSFSPVELFRPLTKYKVYLTNKLSIHAEGKYKVDTRPISFHTPNLKINNVETYWTLNGIGDNEKVYIGINLAFNYEVYPAEVISHLKVLHNKNPLKIELNSDKPAMRIKLLVTPPPGVEFPSQIKLLIAKGIGCVGSTEKTQQQLTYLTQIPGKDQFQVVNSLPDFVDGNSIIRVTTTQPLVDNKIGKYITISPDVQVKISLKSNGFIIKGNFSKDKDYKLQISKGLTSIFGVSLEKDYISNIHFGNPPPYLAFLDKNSIYLSSKGQKNIGVKIINIPKVRVSIFKVYKNNIEDYLRHGKGYQSEYDKDGDYHWFYGYSGNTDYGDTISKRVYNTAALNTSGNAALLHLNLSDFQYKNNNKGLYQIKVQDPEKPWLQDTKLLVISDIGLIVKKGQSHIYAFCNSLVNATPLSNVKISYITNNNQDIHSSTTDGKGISNFSYDPDKYPGSDITMVMAQKGDEFTFMNLNDNQVNVSPFDVGGKTTTHVPYDAFIYSNRDLYRPGDTVHLNTIVRTFDWKTLKGVPVKYKVEMPDGKQLVAMKDKLNNEGASDINFTLPSAAMTGSYNIELYSGNDVFLKSYSILVEEFMPATLKLQLKTDKTEYFSGQTVNLGIKANHLYGPPAVGKGYDVSMSLDFSSFTPKGYGDYTFNIQRPDNTYFKGQEAQGKTNTEGAATSNFKLTDMSGVGVLDGSLLVSVFDATGRPAKQLKKFKVYTQKTFYGIKDFPYWLSSTSPVFFYFASVDQYGKPKTAAAFVQVVKHTWETVLVYSGSKGRYQSQEETKVVYSKHITLNGGKGTLEFDPRVSGDYEVRIFQNQESTSYVSQGFYTYGGGSTAYNSFKVQKEGKIQIKADKPVYHPGDDAKLLFTCPFDGGLIVTVEQNEVLQKYFVKTNQKAASLTIPVEDNYLPNVYITATVLRPLRDNSMPLTIARGIIPLKVEDPQNKLKVEISAADKSRSKTTQTIHVKTEPHAQVTIGVTDEGTLILTDFKIPDPYNYFYGKRALEVNSYDLYPRVLPELYASSMAGDGMMNKRLNPVGAERYHTVAFWSGILTADASGNCSYTIHIPEYSGALRVMATAYKGKKFGSADHTIKVADPIVIETSLPRFLSPGDECVLNVSLMNTTKTKMEATAALTTTNPLSVEGEQSQKITLPPQSEKMLSFKIKAQRAIGAADVNVDVRGLGNKFTKHTQISVRPAAPLQKITGSGVLNGNQVKRVNISGDFINSTAGGLFILSKSPMAQFTKNLNQLLDYPYGCMEQTISTALPVLYYGALVKSLGKKAKNLKYNPSYIINQAIKKVYSQQQYNGGISYWPGQANTDWWVSTYALHFLLECREAGYQVNNTVVDNLVQYIKGKVNTEKTEEYWYWDDHNQLKKKLITPVATCYSLYVLALNRTPDISVMNYYKSKENLLSLSSKYLLAASYALTGDMKSYGSILPEGFKGERAKRTLSDGYYSYIKGESMALNALLEVDTLNPQVPIMARHISKELQQDKWFSTQDNAFALLALGKLAQNAVNSNISASLVISGTNVVSLPKDKVTAEYKGKIPNGTVKLSSSGTGHLYYYYEISGISKTGTVQEGDNYLKVRKTFYDESGNEINSLSFKQGALVIVKISIQSLDNRCAPHVAVTDIIPACFGIQNPRINPVRELKWMNNKSTPNYIDIRDDRITFFTTACPTTKYFYYLVRVTTKGKFKMGPVGADAMYDGSYHSYSGSAEVTVN